MRKCHPAVRRGMIVAFLSAIMMMLGTGSASAHAQLEASDPPADTILASAPRAVTLTFGEGVELADNSIQVFDDHVQRVDEHTVTWARPGHNRIRVSLPVDLHVGTYIVSWHVASADTHPVGGTFRFSIGQASTVSGKVPGAGRNDSAGLLLGIVRGLGYGGLVLGPGVLLVALALWPGGLADRRTRRLLYVGLGLLGLTALGGIVLQGVWSSSRPLSSIWSAPSALDTHSHRFDTLYALRFYLLVVFGAVLGFALSRYARKSVSVRRAALVGVAVSTIALLITWSLAGHAAAGVQPPLALAADMLHLIAMSMWLGGLAILLFSLRPAERAADLAAMLPNFSRLAFGCVTALVLTGSYQAWREVGTLPALTATTFGKVLLIKIVGVVALLALGNLARRWVQRNLVRPRNRSYGTHQVGVLRRGIAVEFAVAAAVLGLTAALVVTVPGRQGFIRHFSRTLTAQALSVKVRVDTPRTGDTVLHLAATTPAGRPMPITGLTGALWQHSAGLGPLPLRIRTAKGAAPSGAEDVGLTFTRRGTWTLQLTVQTSPVDATSFTVPIGVSG